jgi:hypothetical protein
MESDTPAWLVLTDEPYNVPIAGHVTGGKHREFAMASGKMTDAEFLAFNEAWMAALRPRRLRRLYRLTRISDCHSAALKLGLKPLILVLWTKTNAGLAASTAPSTSSCPCSRTPMAKPRSGT